MNRTRDRVFKLAVKDGLKPKDVRGLTDSRSFTGENDLHAVWDFNTNLWYLHFDKGLLPGAFKQSFTKFEYLERTVREYYDRRNIVVKEVVG